jgi:hypothetical protein
MSLIFKREEQKPPKSFDEAGLIISDEIRPNIQHIPQQEKPKQKKAPKSEEGGAMSATKGMAASNAYQI